MQKLGHVRFMTETCLHKMGEYVNGNLLAYDTQNVLLPAGPDGTPSADTHILSIVLTDYGKEVVEQADR